MEKTTTTKIDKMAALFSRAAILLFVAISFLISCTKEELPSDDVKVENRATQPTQVVLGPLDGQGDNILYRGSMSVDNYLVVNKDGTKPARQHTAYNSSKIRLVNFSSISTSKANIGGVVCSRYVVSVNFTDGSVQSFTAFTKDTVSSFILTPKNSLLSSVNQCNYITWISRDGFSSAYNEFRNATTKNNIWEIKCGDRMVSLKVKEPTSKVSMQFMPDHKH